MISFEHLQWIKSFNWLFYYKFGVYAIMPHDRLWPNQTPSCLQDFSVFFIVKKYKMVSILRYILWHKHEGCWKRQSQVFDSPPVFSNVHRICALNSHSGMVHQILNDKCDRFWGTFIRDLHNRSCIKLRINHERKNVVLLAWHSS